VHGRLTDIEGGDELALFSLVFGAPDASRASWFDPVLIHDNPVFVDPFLLDICEEPEFRGSSIEVFEHFRTIFGILAADPQATVLPMLQFPEFAEACLGYTERGVAGSGSGSGRAIAMRQAIGDAIKVGLDSPKHFEELGLLAPRIGADFISDITLRILARRFMDYTARIARELDIPTRPTRIGTFTSSGDGAIWPDAYVAELPRNPHDPARRGIVLVPKVILRQLPTINKSSFENFLFDVHQEELRQRFNITVKRHIKSRVLEIARANPWWVREYTAYEESRGPRPYSFQRDPASVGYSYRLFYEVGLARRARPVDTVEGVLDFVMSIVQTFKVEVEENKGYELLYRDQACTNPKDEKAVQRLFAAVARGMCKQADVFITKESNAGAGPVDFVFSVSYSATVLLETKLISNADFWNGIGGQLPKYMRGHDATCGVVVGVAFTDKEVESERYVAVGEFADRVGKELGYRMVGERVDARPQRIPPSRLPSEVAPPS
jgi:hypothetical protein